MVHVLEHTRVACSKSERLCIARERRGLTQRALATAAGLTSKTISNYEKAGIFDVIASDSMERISAILGYPIDFSLIGMFLL